MQKLSKVFLCLVLNLIFLIQGFTCDAEVLSDTPISVNFQNIPLRQAIEEIKRKANIAIIYNDDDIPQGLLINFQASSKTAQEILQNLLQNTQLAFREHKGNIVIYHRTAAAKKNSDLGTLQGTLKDIESGNVLVGAGVRLVGTTLGAMADENGVYLIKNIPAGPYEVAISYLGYETAVVRDVRIDGDKMTTLDFALKPSSTRLQDVEIIGDKALSGNVVETNEIAMVNEIKTAASIITGISAQQISRSVDQDAAQVARRLPGVAVLNNFVNIRGMHERYNLTYLNGMVAPSSETDTRAFSYDLLPSGMIDKMTVYRSPAPELLGDWAGGVIKIETRNTSIARQLEVNFSTWYRQGSSFEEYAHYQGGKRDWLGGDYGGTRALPKDFPAPGQIPAGDYFSVDFSTAHRNLNQYTAEALAENAAIGRQVYDNWSLQKSRHGLDYRAGINYYDAVRLGKMRLSNLTSISTTQAMQRILQNFNPVAPGMDKLGNVFTGIHYEDTISQQQSRWSLVQNLRLDLNDKHFLEAKALYNQLGIDETLVRDGIDSQTSDSYSYGTDMLYTYRSRSVLGTQLAGSHTFGNSMVHTTQWTAGYGRSEDDMPAQRMVRTEPLDPNDPSGPRYLVSGIKAYSAQNGQYYSNAVERNFTFSLDHTIRFPDTGVFIKAGAFNESKDRNLDARKIYFGGLSRINSDNQYLTPVNAGEMFADDRFKSDGTGAFIFDDPALNGQFNVNADLFAAYAAINISLLKKKLNIYGGVRYEGQKLLLASPASAYVEAKTFTDRYLDYWLPSVNVTYNVTQKILIRAAYGKTLNRPNFRELMPYVVYDPRLNREFDGDSSLVDAEIHNFDLRLEYYPSEGEFISIGAYRKNLSNAIEPYVFAIDESERIYFSNTPRATVEGLELEIRKSFNFLPWRWARGFSIIGNGALLKSEVKFRDGLFNTQNQDFRIYTRPLEGTASFVVNAGLYYDYEPFGTKISALYNVLGQRLILAPTSQYPAYYELPRHGIDLTLRQRITKFLELRFGVQDVLNQPVRRYADYDRNEQWSPYKRSKWPYRDWMFQEFKPGSYYMFGVNLTF